MFLWVYDFIIMKFKITTNFTNFFTHHNFHVFRLTYWTKLINMVPDSQVSIGLMFLSDHSLYSQIWRRLRLMFTRPLDLSIWYISRRKYIYTRTLNVRTYTYAYTLYKHYNIDFLVIVLHRAMYPKWASRNPVLGIFTRSYVLSDLSLYGRS